MNWLAEASVSSAKEGLVINGINIPVAALAVFLIGFGFVDAIGLILLLEATALMLGGGAMELGATASTKRLVSIFQGRRMEWTGKDYRDAQKRGAVFTITGLLLFAESLLMAVLVLR